jgi:hypothetical protein
MERIFAPEERRELIRGWLIHARKGWKKHEMAARRLESRYRTLGVISVTLSAVVGASLFASLEADYGPWGRITAGIVSIAAAALASLITFNRYAERTEHHRAAAARYKLALRELERTYAQPHDSEPDQATLDKIQGEFDDLEKSAPVVPEEVDRAVEDHYQVYEFVAKAADLRVRQEDCK